MITFGGFTFGLHIVSKCADCAFCIIRTAPDDTTKGQCRIEHPTVQPNGATVFPEVDVNSHWCGNIQPRSIILP